MRTWNWLALFVVVVMLAGCSGKKDGDKKTDESRASAKSGERDGKGAGQGKLAMSSKEFAQQFKDDSDGAKKKFEGRTVELTGPIVGVGRGFTEDSRLDLEGVPDGGIFAANVSCYTKDARPWRKALPGQTVKVRGKVSDSGAAALGECEILEVTDPAPASFTADQLAAEIGQGAENAKKLEMKYVVLTGEIAQSELNEVKVASITFKTQKPKPAIIVVLGQEYAEESAKLKPGQRLKVVGRYSAASGGDGEIRIGPCVISDLEP